LWADGLFGRESDMIIHMPLGRAVFAGKRYFAPDRARTLKWRGFLGKIAGGGEA
jgi:hypothetical protein